MQWSTICYILSGIGIFATGGCVVDSIVSQKWEQKCIDLQDEKIELMRNELFNLKYKVKDLQEQLDEKKSK